MRGLGQARLIGVDTPEVYGGRECFGAEASAFTKRELPAGASVRYELGAEPRDRYGWALVYLERDRRLVNEILVSEGYATPLAIEPNTKHARRFDDAATGARRAGRGLWKSCR